MTLVAIYLATSIWLGATIVRLLLPISAANHSAVLLKSILATAVGLGISSCTLFLTGLTFDSLSHAACFVELGILVAFGAGLLVMRQRFRLESLLKNGRAKLLLSRKLSWSSKKTARQEPRPPRKSDVQSSIDWPTEHSSKPVVTCLLVVFVVIALLASVQYARHAASRPDGQWDAWAIWNLRARFLFSAEHDWTNAFLDGFASPHVDYPLLLPLTTARFWTYLESDTRLVPQIVAITFTFGTCALLVCSLAALRTWSQGLLAGAVLLTTQVYLENGTWQLADIPLSFFYLAVLALLAVKHRLAEQRGRVLILAGLMGGLAAWTKNEGCLFLLVVFLTNSLAVAGVSGWRNSVREAGALILGMLPIVAVLIFFKLRYAPGNDLIEAQGVDTFAKLTDWSRHATVAAGFWNNFYDLARSLVWILPFYTVVMGTRRMDGLRGEIAPIVAVMLLMYAGYFTVFVVSPNDLNWHLTTACRRLLLQLWPCSLFAIFLVIATPEDSWRRKSV